MVTKGWTPVFFFGPDEADDAAIDLRARDSDRRCSPSAIAPTPCR